MKTISVKNPAELTRFPPGPTVSNRAAESGRPEARVVGAPTGRLDVALQQVQQGDSVAEPVAEAGVVVLLPFNLAAHGVDDLVKQHGAVCLEDLPLQAAAEDEDCCHWAPVMEAEILCNTAAMQKSACCRIPPSFNKD